MNKCFRCDAEIPEGETECQACAQGIPPELRAAMGAGLRLKVAEINWELIRSLPLEERLDALVNIMSCAIPGVVQNSPQFFQILKYIKK